MGSPAASSVGTISGSGLYTPPASAGTHTILATSIANPQQSGSATAAVTDLAGIYTYHNDVARTGQNLHEYALTPARVASGGSANNGPAASTARSTRSPCMLRARHRGGTHNVLFVATQHDSVYAIDADNRAARSIGNELISAAAGATPIPSSDTDTAGHQSGVRHHRHAGHRPGDADPLFRRRDQGKRQLLQRCMRLPRHRRRAANSPVAIGRAWSTTQGHHGELRRAGQNQRPGLALAGGRVYIGWARIATSILERLDDGLRRDPLAQTAVLNTTPNGSDGGIWMSGGAPADGLLRQLYVSTGNGTFETPRLDVVPPVADGRGLRHGAC